MKELFIFLIFAFIILLAMKMRAYLRFIKLHNNQVMQMDEIITELKAKQKILNQRAKIIQNSEEFQKNNFNDICANIYKTIDKII